MRQEGALPEPPGESGDGAVAGAPEEPPSAALALALARYQRERAPAAEALARISRIGFPYQYGQGPAWRQALFTAGFACRLLLSKLNERVFAPPAAFQILAGEPYDRIWQRCQRTTRLLQSLGALAVSGLLLRRVARFVL